MNDANEASDAFDKRDLTIIYHRVLTICLFSFVADLGFRKVSTNDAFLKV